MTARTKASLGVDLSSGGSADNGVETKFIVDLIDTMGLQSEVDAINAANSRVLFTLTDANMNVTTDQAFTKVGTFTNYLITFIRVTGASISLTTAVGGIYDTAAKAGAALVAATQAYSALTGPTIGLDLTIAAVGKGIQSDATLFLSLTDAQGAAATADFVIVGVPV